MIAFLYYYLPELRFIFFIFYIRGFIQKLIIEIYLRDVLIFTCILILFFSKIQFGVLSSLLYIRLFFGLWFVEILTRNQYLNIDRWIILLPIWTIIEYFLFQFFPEIIGNWPNYINSEGAIQNYFFSGIFAGPYSFGGNRTITGVCLLALGLYQKKNKFLYYSATVLSFSTTAILLLIASLLWKNKKYFLIIIPFIYLFINIDFGYRLSLDYISKILFEYKLNQIEESKDILKDNLILGNGNITSENLEVSNFGLYFGDFFILDLLSINGFLGLFIFLFIVFSKINSKNYLSIIVLILGSLHYHVLFSLPGQIIFSYLIFKNEK